MSGAVPDALLTLLRWCLLALVYLFFFRVLQATWHGALAPKRTRSNGKVRNGARLPAAAGGGGGPAPAPVSTTPSRLTIVEPPEKAGVSHAINTELTIGRAAGCQVTLDDTYISQIHTRLNRGESGVVVEDLGSTNGTYLNRQRVTAPTVVGIGDRLQVGSVVMELS